MSPSAKKGEINVQIDPEVFNEVYLPLLDDLAPLQIIYGGSSSGKSVFVAQRCVVDVLKGGRNYLVARKVGNTIRRSVFNEILKVINDWNLQRLFKVNKTEMTITCENGYQILFAGLEDPQRLKSITPAKGVLTDIWVEEATETDREDLKQLEKRLRGIDPATTALVPKRITLTFNPINQDHHIYVEFFSKVGWADDQREHRTPELSITKTWYVHNRFLAADDIERLLNEADDYYRNVYTFGNWGVLGNVIFKNWRVADLSKELPDNLRVNRRHGLDFGFSSDPAAMPSTHYDKKHKTIYIYGELYEYGLTNDRLADLILERIQRDIVTADSAEPKSIAELRHLNVNVVPAEKGKDSVEHGIQWLQQHTLVVDVNCINMQNELRQYKWKERNGIPMAVPVDRLNHLIDGLRYGHERDMKESWLFTG